MKCKKSNQGNKIKMIRSGRIRWGGRRSREVLRATEGSGDLRRRSRSRWGNVVVSRKKKRNTRAGNYEY